MNEDNKDSKGKNTISEHPMKLTRHLYRNCEKSETFTITSSCSIAFVGIGKLTVFRLKIFPSCLHHPS